MQYVDVPLSRLEHAGCWTDPEVVNGWMNTLNAGRPIPPPVAVVTERGTYYLHDGNHRLDALTRFLADEGEHARVRVAVAIPKPGNRFVYQSFGEYGTYVIQDCPLRFANTARLVTAILASTIALVLSALLPAADRGPIYALFVLSVMIAAWAGGWKTGLFASLLNSIGAAYFLLSPNGSLRIASSGQMFHFAVTALIMIAAVLFMQVVQRHPSVKIGLPRNNARTP
ncbi:MAG: hypothetical protein CXZ00_10675 [Acidobacteria bacterium]|nr:MAG: hypothetical protein CXZ00_10675 [Acidobacteriota bacterium]